MFAAARTVHHGMESADMSTKIGPFEILSELAKSPSGAVYKANDPESGQTVALKVIQLSAFGDSAKALEQALLEEAEKAKILSSSNITPVFGAGEIEGQFCAAMEYVQGNSIATMLARKEGFSIWDLLDIGRQLCSGLDHAASHNLVHYSLEPAKIMCGWDGTVKILSFGVSSVGNFAQHVSEGLPSVLHYMSPEQVQGQPMDVRSNLFSLGAMFYEMITERKAFDRDDIESLRQSVVENTPVPPVHVNAKVHPLLSDLIMRALSKDPAQRYSSGRALLDDLERCKESRTLTPKKAEPAKGTMASSAMKAAAQSKFVTSANPAAKPAAPATPVASRPAQPKAASPATPRIASPKPAAVAPSKTEWGVATPAKSKAAAAGVSSNAATPSATESPEIDLSDSFINASAKATISDAEPPSAYMSSAAVDEPQVETFEPQGDTPKIAVDPMMAEGGPAGGSGRSFSEIDELPPLKEAYVAPPPPPPQAPVEETEKPAPAAPTVFSGKMKHQEEKPKVQPREVAEKAIKEIKSVPPKLMFYALGAAGALILAIGIGVTVYVRQQNSDDDASAARTQPVVEQSAPPANPRPATTQPAPTPAPAEVAPQSAQPEGSSEPEAAAARSGRAARSRTAKKKSAPEAPAIIPGQLALDSTPQGAQVQLDGQTSASYVTPFALTNVEPGQHTITVSKPGYSSDTRTVTVLSGNRSTIVVHLSQLMATLVVNSNPSGASVYVDGRDTGTKTPAQVSVNKGQHVVLVRKMGYIDETMNTQFVLGQTFNFAPTLRPLGNVDDIHTVGKMSRLFGGGKVQAGQAAVSIRTQPKGAQVAINEHVMEKSTPLEVALDPGNYVIDITMTGYAPVHKVISADRGGKVVVDEVLQPQ
jgi:eukaryotic-like serine/threonine-protein kinase